MDDRMILKYICTLSITGAVILLSAGCGTPILLEKDFVQRIAAPADSEAHVVYCSDDFTTSPNGTILEKKNVVVRVGANAAAFPRVLLIAEDATETILDIAGRVIHRDGSSARIPSGDFFRVNLSDKEKMAEEYARTASIPDRLGPGDLVETAALVEHRFPQAGIIFSPSDLEYPSDNVTCSIETSGQKDLRYDLVNADVVPIVHTSAAGKKYVFTFPPYRPPTREDNAMLQKNRWPILVAAPENETWASFGDWYLELIRDKLLPGKAISDTTARVIEGKSTAREKLDAIFEYCRRAIRYEQLYLANGEFVPNAADVVFSRRFGDCKDYATLMHAMAASAGITTDLALCHRGRGELTLEKLPAFEFNHMILHYTDNGTDCWYDATDRLGLSQEPSFDLANARALVIEKGRSRFVTIDESPLNLTAITGRLGVSAGNGLKGSLSVKFAHQYAVEFSWEREHLNSVEMRSSLTATVKNLLNDDLIVDTLTWSATPDAFLVNVSCTIPNSLTKLGGKTYTSPARLFPNLLPDEIDTLQAGKAFFCPYMNRVALDAVIDTDREPLDLHLCYQLPAGPFDDATRGAFLSALTRAHADFTRSCALGGNSRP